MPTLLEAGTTPTVSATKRIAMLHGNKSPGICKQALPLRPGLFMSGRLARPSLVRPLAPAGLRPSRRRAASFTTRAASSSVTESKQWWKSNKELWIEPHTQEDFWKAVAEGPEPLVFVEYFATWCEGCKKIYPTLCSVASSDEWRGKVKFIKMCVDEHKQFSKELGVKALPYCQLYRTGQTDELVGFQTVPSRAKAIKSNLQVVVNNPESKWFRLDPNGFVVVSDQPPPDAQAKAKRAAALDAMRNKSNDLHARLMAVASTAAGQGGAAGTAPAAEAAGGASPASSAPPAQSAGTGQVNGNGSAADAGSAVGAAGGSDLEKDKALFMRKNRREYGYDGWLEENWQREVGCRLPPGHHYLDYTGSSLYTNSQLQAAVQELSGAVFGNPHSDNPSSLLSSERVEAVRDMVRRYFNAPADEYQVVFTPSATGSLKLVGETFPWGTGSDFRYLRVNHNSVLGVRQYALDKGATYHSVEDDWVEDWVKNKEQVEAPGAREDGTPTYSLFAFPAEDNFAGVKYPLSWIEAVQSKSVPGQHEWKVLVDGAAYIPTQPLDLSKTPADFVSVSFYKMFGYPTGLGALLIRTEDVNLLQKVFWGGGSVSLAVPGDNFHVLKCEPAERLEDGTVAFLDIIALRHGFELLQRLGGVTKIQAHVASLTQWLYTRMRDMKHSNGSPMFVIFGRHGSPDASTRQGAILNFELLKPDGSVFSYRTFQKESAAAGFHLRTGAECNPGACYKYVGITEREVATLAGQKEGCDDDVEWITVERPVKEQGRGSRAISGSTILDKLKGTKLQLGHEGEIAMKWVQKPLGTIRASLGHLSTFEDVHALATWMEATYKDRESE